MQLLRTVLVGGHSSTGPATSVVGSISTPDSIGLIKRMPILTMRFGSIPLELGLWRTVQILSVRLCYQMGRIYTCWISASMANLKPQRDIPISQLVTEPMGENATRATPSQVNLPIAKRNQTLAHPRPAIVWATRLINLSPKPFLKGAYNLFRAQIYKRVPMTMPAPIVHPAPATFLNRFGATFDGTFKVYHV